MLRKLAIVSMMAVLASAGTFVSCSDQKVEDTRSVALAVSGHLSGAVFTTTSDGGRVNANLYPAMEDVYLDGGPGPNAPAKAAGLPEGDYYFQVTDPSGKDLLSTDHISCRKVHVSADGVIDNVYAGTNYAWVNKDKEWVGEPCQHEQGVDQDHDELGALTVQLYPYDQTPNKGGVYKVWMTRVGDYAGSALAPVDKNDAVNGEGWEPANAHGFIPAFSKTDNYKVERKGPPCDTPVVTVDKFHDANMNATQDPGEANVVGWAMTVALPNGSSNLVCTPATLDPADVGDYGVTEATPEGTLQTVGILDGAAQSTYPTADPTVLFTVTEECTGETHEIVFGNVGLGEVTACKVFDRNADGVADESEPGVAGWAMNLGGTVATAAAFDETLYTGEDGCVTFGGLLPGDYTLTELVPTTGGWVATGDTTTPITIESTLTGGELGGTIAEHAFTNVCTDTTPFNTKGYWHNKNGLAEVEWAYVDEVVNDLLPYASPSTYFGAGDEPFDGTFADLTTPVAASKGILGETIAPEGSWQAELSQFLVDSNGEGDPREQLAQQLLAFVLNTEYRLGGPDTAILLPNGTFMTAGNAIDAAVDIWDAGTDAERHFAAALIDMFNNDDAVEFVPGEPCTVAYP
jgi:hypothetical protein